ncbi:MAG: hypothetical protein HYY25_01515 [Candidatus Wallbacteria bacterium]|nr:hypothetical protein [Candidatus Wallbacteria bacterium]
MSVRRSLSAFVPAAFVSLSLALGATEIGLTTPPSPKPVPRSKDESSLKTVHDQAVDMHFSATMLGEIGKIFPAELPGVRIREDKPVGEEVIVEKPAERKVRIIKSRQVATAVTDDEGTSGGRRLRPRSVAAATSKPGETAEPASGAALFVEENRELEDKLSQEITAKLKPRGYDVQALTARMESLTAVKVIMLATVGSLSEANARQKLSEVKKVIESDVLTGYPNMGLTKASSFGLAAATGADVTEASAMAYELDREDFRPTVRQKSVAVPEATLESEPARAAEGSGAKKRKPRKPVLEAPERAPAAVTLSDKEKAERAREPAAAAPAAKPPVKDEVKEKARQETITPSEADFQD